MRSREIYPVLRTAHDAITKTARPAVASHLALAFYKEGDIFDHHVSAAMHDQAGYISTHIAKVPRDKEAFESWEGRHALYDAIILDTMMNVQGEMLGGDDSRADYMPDGIRQVQLLTLGSYDDANDFLWFCINNLYATVPPFDDTDAEKAEWVEEQLEAIHDVYMQDCTSGILYDLSRAFNA